MPIYIIVKHIDKHEVADEYHFICICNENKDIRK